MMYFHRPRLTLALSIAARTDGVRYVYLGPLPPNNPPDFRCGGGTNPSSFAFPDFSMTIGALERLGVGVALGFGVGRGVGVARGRGVGVAFGVGRGVAVGLGVEAGRGVDVGLGAGVALGVGSGVSALRSGVGVGFG